jgi:hypothetical protein
MLQYSEERLLEKNCHPVSTRIEESPCEKEKGQIYDENGSDTVQPLHFTFSYIIQGFNTPKQNK